MKPSNRSELVTSSVAAGAASTGAVAEGQGDHISAAGPFAVRSGEGRPGGEWLIHGEKAFSTKVSGADVSRRYTLVEVHTPPGRGSELHVHPVQNELFFVLKGSIGVQCGSDRVVLEVGDSFMAPVNVAHGFVALGTEPAHMLLFFEPAGEMEAFFAEYSPLVDVDGEPDQKELAEVYARHGLKVVGPPLGAARFRS